MDVFGANQKEKLDVYKQNKLLLSPLDTSTITVQGSITDLGYHEEEISQMLVCEYPIIKIKSNFCHYQLEGYQDTPKIKKSNRGRKKKIKPKSLRAIIGNGSSFNSQTTFSVLGEVIRQTPFDPDKHSLIAEKIIIDNQEYEKFNKIYKIKIFRNGRFTVPGVLLEDLSDVKNPLENLTKYFSDLFINQAEVKELFSVMRNYKCHLLSSKIDIKQLHTYCVSHFQQLLNTKFSDIEEFIINPIFTNLDFNPNSLGWKGFIDEYRDHKMPLEFSISDLKIFLIESKSVKNLFVDFNKLKAKIQEINLIEIYNKIRNIIVIIQENYFVSFSNNIIKLLVKYYLINELKSIDTFLKKSKDNMLSYIKYDSEKYPGFLIKIKTPNKADSTKKTTVKIFPSGKINIDGCNSREEAEFIYYWLNNLFANNDLFIYDSKKNNFLEKDPEFSSDSEDE